ncbi:MAG: hypothetical protein NPIRA06_24500 [Nitrospirales bacterium]|nr:MAG: hypothetical protein NPIRA06_24500 [Nitrospirales bacterium]
MQKIVQLKAEKERGIYEKGYVSDLRVDSEVASGGGLDHGDDLYGCGSWFYSL